MGLDFIYEITEFDEKATLSIYAYGNGFSVDINKDTLEEVNNRGDEAILELFGDTIEAYYEESLIKNRKGQEI